ncbi:MAG TPA: 3-hydroxyisobutyryl-CoA hydrolase, partial [Cupriavidus sp.]|nr:3-hydroxyisobutyryl-CoA hydrolase [Cupriavidus sp.]
MCPGRRLGGSVVESLPAIMEAEMTEFVSTQVQGGVAYLTLTRPQALNAL